MIGYASNFSLSCNLLETEVENFISHEISSYDSEAWFWIDECEMQNDFTMFSYMPNGIYDVCQAFL